MKVKDLLPIGSVVIMENGEQPLMIYGVKQTYSEGLFIKKDTVYDYICVPYPYGYMGSDKTFLIFHKDIAKILFKGYESNEQNNFLDELSDIYGE